MLERTPHLEESALLLATQVFNELTGAREIDTVALQLAAHKYFTSSLALAISIRRRGQPTPRTSRRGCAEPVTGRATRRSLLRCALCEVIDVLRREDSLFLGEIVKPSGKSSYLNGARYLQQWRDMRGQKFRDEAHKSLEPAE